MADHTEGTRATGTSPGSTPAGQSGAPSAGGSTMEKEERGLRERAGEARGEAERMKDDAKTKVREAKDKVRSKADDLKGDAREKARDVRHEAERKAQHWASAAGERTGSLGRAFRAAADSLRDEGEPGMADLAGRAAEQVERMSGYLEDEDPSAMLHDLEDMGRRNPGTFVGSTFAMGLLLGRFLRSSSPSGDGASADDGGSPTGRVPTATSTTDRYASPRTGPAYGGSKGGRPGADAASEAGRPGTRSAEAAEQGDYPAGDSRPSSPSAPASAGETLGSGGTVDPTSGPDIRPSSEAKERGREKGTGETPVRSPSGGASSGQNVRTGSAGASSASAGSGTTHRSGGEDRSGGTTTGSGSGRPGGNPQSSGSPTSGTGAPTGDRKEDESDER